MKSKILMIFGIIALASGCATKEKPYLGKDSNKIAISKCANCNKKSFYENGKTFDEDKK